jgi:hypothetical protein
MRTRRELKREQKEGSCRRNRGWKVRKINVMEREEDSREWKRKEEREDKK